MLALILMLAAVVAGLKQLENAIVVTGLNYGKQSANERADLITQGLASGMLPVNPDTGAVVDTTILEGDRKASVGQSEKAQSSMQVRMRKGRRLYQARNWLLLVGFLVLLGARVAEAFELERMAGAAAGVPNQATAVRDSDGAESSDNP